MTTFLKNHESHIYFQDTYRFGLSANKSFEPLDDSEYYLDKGKYILPFEYCLPENLPPSLCSKYGSISYTIEASHREPRKGRLRKAEAAENEMWINSKTVRCKFSVNCTLDLNQLPYLHAEQLSQVKDSRNVCSFFHCKLSPVHATLKIEKCGFALGEEIKFTAEIRNMSSRSVENILMGLVQEVTCTTVIESVTYTHVYRKKVTDICHKDIFKGDYDHWADKFPIPIVPPTWKDPEKIISIRYFVKLSMKIFTIPLQTLELSLSIIIGTIPLRPNRVYNQTNPAPNDATDCICDSFIDENEYGENSEIMEAFQIEEEKDNTQYSTISSSQMPLRTISGQLFEADNNYRREDRPFHENLFPG